MKPLQIICQALLLLFFTAGASADTTIKSFMKSNGFNGIGAFEATSTDYYQGIKSRHEQISKFKGLLRLMGKQRTDNITDVNKMTVYELFIKKKKYKEYPIKTFSEVMKQREDVMRDAKKKNPEMAKQMNQPRSRVKKTSFVIKNLGKDKVINNFKTNGKLIIMSAQIEEIQSGAINEYKWTNELWLAPKTGKLKKAWADQQKFQSAYFRAMELSFDPNQGKAMGSDAIGMMLGVGDKKSKDLVKNMIKKVKSVKGYPIVVKTSWTTKQIKAPKLTPEQKKALAQAKKEADAKASAKAEDASADDDMDVNYSGGAKGIAGSLMGNIFKKKMKEKAKEREKKRLAKQKAAQQKAAQGGGFTSLPIETYFEVKDVNVGGISADKFKVPGKFKKIKEKKKKKNS